MNLNLKPATLLASNFRQKHSLAALSQAKKYIIIYPLIEEHKKEIWEWKKKESEWIKTAHQLANAKNLISELSSRIVKAFTVIAELEKKLKEKQ